MSRVTLKAFGKAPAGIATGQCLCGKEQVEFTMPAFWAWHDHSRASRREHGAAYATYGREPLYHVAVEDSPEWAYRYERLRPLKGYPGVMWTGPKRRKRPTAPGMPFEP